ncbi:hypothetical protein [uncultured Jannaschia sp.]|uniref:hypothetical protein n=1 Tax=uncultured Jannaschia sp. TaxID=293347 RepID=UPI002631DC90|nr:hypothetical protein [uncultured Jannaschia sp.]
MIRQLPGACLRALLVVVMVATPSLLLPGATDISEITILAALVAGAFVLSEYAAPAPNLLEFRSAPPYNRIRFAILLAMLTLIAVAFSGGGGGSVLQRLVLAVGLLLGGATDFVLSPIWLILRLMPTEATPVQAQTVRAAAGLAYLVGLVGLSVFAIAIRVLGWPARGDALNIWINLPTCDPNARGDVVARLRRAGAVNISLGILAPYLMPPLALLGARAFGLSMLRSDLLLVWVMSLWAFLPVCLFLRGIALRRLALTIALRRRRRAEVDADPGFLPA